MENGGDRCFRFVVLGASGFAGQFVVEELVRVLNEIEMPMLCCAVAGRSREKLEGVLSQVARKLAKNDVKSDVAVIICDVNDPGSLDKMCKKTSLVMNCVGPYRFLGEPVVKTCVENRTHYIDICGEPQMMQCMINTLHHIFYTTTSIGHQKFLEEMYLKYDRQAAENGVYVVGSTGFCSIAADLGVIFTQNVEGTLTTVESFFCPKLSTKGIGINITAWQAIIHGFGFRHRLKKLRKRLAFKPLPFSDKTIKRNIFYCKKQNVVAIPFPASDTSVVRRTQQYLYETQQKIPVHYTSYSVVNGFISALLLLFAGFLIALLAKFKCGRNLLVKYSDFFSCGAFSDKGPTQRGIAESSFQMRFIGKGYSKDKDPDYDKPNMVVYTSVKGPEPAYSTTSIAMVQAAVTILNEPESLPKGGGVFTPGAAFSQTTIIERLNKSSISFSVDDIQYK